jgi:hypothetical protein
MKQQTVTKNTKTPKPAAVKKAALPSNLANGKNDPLLGINSDSTFLVKVNSKGNIYYSFKGGVLAKSEASLVFGVNPGEKISFACQDFPIAVGLIPSGDPQGDRINFRIASTEKGKNISFQVPLKAKKGDQYKFSVAVFLGSSVGSYQPGDILVSDPILRIIS